MYRIQQLTAAAFVALAVFVIRESLALEYYTKLGPGPGFFPFWLAALFGTLALAWLLQLFRSRPAGIALLPEAGSLFRILAVVGALSAITGLLNVLGFQVAMFLFLAFLLRVLGRQQLWLTAVAAFLGSVGIYHVFGRYLDVQLPTASLPVLAGLGL